MRGEPELAYENFWKIAGRREAGHVADFPHAVTPFREEVGGRIEAGLVDEVVGGFSREFPGFGEEAGTGHGHLLGEKVVFFF